jgi:hypothetical protein
MGRNKCGADTHKCGPNRSRIGAAESSAWLAGTIARAHMSNARLAGTIAEAHMSRCGRPERMRSRHKENPGGPEQNPRGRVVCGVGRARCAGDSIKRADGRVRCGASACIADLAEAGAGRPDAYRSRPHRLRTWPPSMRRWPV